MISFRRFACLLLFPMLMMTAQSEVWTIESCHSCKLQASQADTSTNCSIGQSAAERNYSGDCQTDANKFCYGPNLVQPGPTHYGCAIKQTVDLSKYPELCTYDDLKKKMSERKDCVCEYGSVVNDTDHVHEMIRNETSCQVGELAVQWKVKVVPKEETGSCGTGCIVGICLGLGFFAGIVCCLFLGIHQIRKKEARSKAMPTQSALPVSPSVYPMKPSPSMGPLRHK